VVFRVLTSGDSHGEAPTAVIDGVPAGLSLTEDHIDEIHRNHRAYLDSLKAW
jgi:chorismate synthase